MTGRVGVGVTGNENDWNPGTRAAQPVVELEPRQPGHADIEQDAIEMAVGGSPQEFVRRPVRLHSVPAYFEQAGEASSNGEVVVDHTNGQTVHDCVPIDSITGSVR